MSKLKMGCDYSITFRDPRVADQKVLSRSFLKISFGFGWKYLFVSWETGLSTRR